MFGKNIKKLRNVRALSQEAFADLFELKRGTLAAYEEGRSNPRVETVIKIAQHFKIGLDELLLTELTVNRLLQFNDSLTTEAHHLPTVQYASIPCITDKNQAEFILQYNTAAYLERMPHLHLPLPLGVPYIAYTICNLEMTWPGGGLFPKDLVIGKPLDQQKLPHLPTGTVILIIVDNKLICRRANVAGDLIQLTADFEGLDAFVYPINQVVAAWEIVHVFQHKLPNRQSHLEQRLALLEERLRGN